MRDVIRSNDVEIKSSLFQQIIIRGNGDSEFNNTINIFKGFYPKFFNDSHFNLCFLYLSFQQLYFVLFEIYHLI